MQLRPDILQHVRSDNHPLRQQVRDFLTGLLFPRVCPVCGEILETRRQTQNANPYICPDCAGRLCCPEEPRCLRCSRPLHSPEEEYCPDCSGRRLYFEEGTALLMHDDTARKLLYDLKYSNKRDNADLLAHEAARRLAGRIAMWRPEVIVPVPLHKEKRRQRGFNQAELLARRLAFCLRARCGQIPVDASVLVRTKQTSAQKGLGQRQRQINIYGAFAVSPAAAESFHYKRVLLVDDIYTSGATLSECARVLKKHGAQKVYFLTFSIG